MLYDILGIHIVLTGKYIINNNQITMSKILEIKESDLTLWTMSLIETITIWENCDSMGSDISITYKDWSGESFWFNK